MVLAERLMFFRISHWSVLTRLLSVKFVGLAVGAFDIANCSLSVVCGRNIKKIAEIRAGSLSCLAPSPLDFALAAMPRANALVPQRESARRLFLTVLL